MSKISHSDLFTDENNRMTMPIFPKTTPFSANKGNGSGSGNGSIGNGPKNETDNDNHSDFVPKDRISTIMSQFKKEDEVEGFLTGTDINLNFLQGNIFSFGKTDTTKNPIQPFSTREGLDAKEPVSYKEGLTNSDTSSNTVTTTTTGTVSAGKSARLIELEKELSELTTKYTTQYRVYTDDLLTRSTFLQTNSKYLNKVVRDLSYIGTDASAAFYYVNSFGYTHRYRDASSVLLNDSTCPKLDNASSDKPAYSTLNPFQIKDLDTAVVDISGTGSVGFSRFSDYASYDMVSTPCIVAKNVKTILTNGNAEYAWVDVEGKKHIYEKGVWPDKRSSSCSTATVGEPIDLILSRYNAIPTASDAPMKEETECFKSSVAPTINTRLSDLKKQIEDVIASIKKENQNIANSAANTTIIQRDKTISEKLADLDDNILAQIKTWLGDYYYPAVYVFWCFVILIAILIIFKFAFFFVSPGSYDSDTGETSSGGMSLLGVVILSLIVIFAVYYYFMYTYNLNVSVKATDAIYTVA
jgi:hypothetical protein